MGDQPIEQDPEFRHIEVSEVDGVAVVRFHDLNADVSSCEAEKIESLAAELFAVAEQSSVTLILDFEGQVFVPGLFSTA